MINNWGVVGGYRYHGETHGVQILVVNCASANFLGVEYEQYYIQKCPDYIAQPKYPYIFLKYPSKNGVFEM